MGEPDIVVIRVCKDQGIQKLKNQWSKKYPKLKSCYVPLEKLPLSEGGPIKSTKDPKPVHKNVRRKSNKSISRTSKNGQRSKPKSNELDKVSTKPIDVVVMESKLEDFPFKKPMKLNKVEPKVLADDEPLIVHEGPHNSKKKMSPLKEKELKIMSEIKLPPETKLTPFPKEYTDMASIIYHNCFQINALPGQNTPASIYVQLIENHRKNCHRCDAMICAKFSKTPSLFDPYVDKTFQLMEMEKQLRETQMILKMSEEARAIMDNMYEEKLSANLVEINELKRMIQVLIQEEVPKDTAEVLEHQTQPILETKERKYYTSCGYNMMNMTALREALNKAQKCGHGNLIILEHEDERDHLASRLVFLCQTCKNETIFYTSGFSSKTPGYFTINKAVLNTLGPNAFFKLVDFVKHTPFSKPAKFMGPFLSDKDGTKDKVKLILGIDKFEFEDWTKLDPTAQKRSSVDSRDDEIEIIETGDHEGKRIKIKNLEPIVNLRNEDYGSLVHSNKKNLSVVDELKLEYLRKNPDRPRLLFPELPVRPKIAPKPISQLLASPPKQSVTVHSDLTPIINSNNSINNSNIVNGGTKAIINTVDKSPSLSTQNKALSSLPPILKIKPSKDLPPGSRILSIAPGTKLMSTNVCHSTKQDTGLSHGVYRVIDDKNNEKILIIKDLQQPGSPPVANIVNLKAVKTNKSSLRVPSLVSQGIALPIEETVNKVTVTSLPTVSTLHNSTSYKLNSPFGVHKVTKIDMKTHVLNTNGINSSAPIKCTTKVVSASLPLTTNGITNLIPTHQLIPPPSTKPLKTLMTTPSTSILKIPLSNNANDAQPTKTSSNKRKAPSESVSALKETQATLLSLKNNWYESPVQESDPLADPLGSDDINMDSESTKVDDNNIELKSSNNPLVKIVSILPEEDEVGGSGDDDKLVPLLKCDIETESDIILENTQKRMKISC
ncbi:uncharacterized protein [Lepeophtheirus salmonis]|uniref:uncharacterized protein n=1 Tax=Lepeophtheirus salmonis TaxID=72036 RepID=UPI001AE346A4|nr:uncharacterized protein LOC121119499 [Lepeophtheirus salmonis]